MARIPVPPQPAKHPSWRRSILSQATVSPVEHVRLSQTRLLKPPKPCRAIPTTSTFSSTCGNLSPYFPNLEGFGVDEYSVPSNCNITQVHVLSRHGSRYPTEGSDLEEFAGAIRNASSFKANGSLEYDCRRSLVIVGFSIHGRTNLVRKFWFQRDDKSMRFSD